MAQISNSTGLAAGTKTRTVQASEAAQPTIAKQVPTTARTVWGSELTSRAPKTVAKKVQILAGARSAFYKLGFEGASVDEIARSSGVSKATLYNHYEDKTAVFRAIMEEDCEEHARQIFAFEDEVASTDITVSLDRVAHRFIALILSPFAQNMYRVVTAEALRFPALAESFCKSGPDLVKKRLIEILEPAIERGELVIDDIEMAAEQFLQLCKTGPMHKSAFQDTQNVSEAQIARAANGAVRVFMSAYGSKS